MFIEQKTVMVAYTKLQNGHGFQAADKTAKWLLVANHDLQQGIEEVSGQLAEILGGEWHPTEETQAYLKKDPGNAGSKEPGSGLAPFSGFAGIMHWQSVSTT